MRIIHTAAAVLLSVLAWIVPASAQKPGDYDHYIFSLSWSPAHCGRVGAAGDPRQCSNVVDPGFVIQGLWPQSSKGVGLERCSTMQKVPPNIVDAMLEVMPSERAIEQEWAMHGSCTGLPPDEYFAETRAAWERIGMPDEFLVPPPGFSVSVTELEKRLLAANRLVGLTPEAMVLLCDKDQVYEARFCMDKDLNFLSCNVPAKDRCRPSAKLRTRASAVEDMLKSR